MGPVSSSYKRISCSRALFMMICSVFMLIFLVAVTALEVQGGTSKCFHVPSSSHFITARKRPATNDESCLTVKQALRTPIISAIQPGTQTERLHPFFIRAVREDLGGDKEFLRMCTAPTWWANLHLTTQRKIFMIS